MTRGVGELSKKGIVMTRGGQDRPRTEHIEGQYWLVSDKIAHISASKYCPLLDIGDVTILIYHITKP